MMRLETALKVINEDEDATQEEKKIANTFPELIKKNPKTVEEVLTCMSILCFRSLAFCCDFQNECPYRDSVLRVLKIKGKDFREVKQKAIWSLLEGQLGIPNKGGNLCW